MDCPQFLHDHEPTLFPGLLPSLMLNRTIKRLDYELPFSCTADKKKQIAIYSRIVMAEKKNFPRVNLEQLRLFDKWFLS